MSRLKIEGLPPYNGEYDIDLAFTNRDLHTIKRITGFLPGDVEQAMNRLDNDMVVAFAINALRRKGHIVDEDTLWDAEVGKITLIGDRVDDADPPPPTSSEGGTRPDEPTASSGASGNNGGDSHQVSDQSSTGTSV